MSAAPSAPSEAPAFSATAAGTSPLPPVRPTWAFLRAHPAHAIALGFGAGLSRVAPGTAGTLWGWAVFVVLSQLLSPFALGVVTLAAWPVGWWACTVAARNLRVPDPGAVVWDEIAAIWLVLWLVLPAGLLAQIVAFLLFRLFDAAKPGPVGWADRLIPHDPTAPRWALSGLGILLDDLVAAFCTLLVIALARALWW